MNLYPVLALALGFVLWLFDRHAYSRWVSRFIDFMAGGPVQGETK